mgnify:CR=1 FL=1
MTRPPLGPLARLAAALDHLSGSIFHFGEATIAEAREAPAAAALTNTNAASPANAGVSCGLVRSSIERGPGLRREHGFLVPPHPQPLLPEGRRD